MRRLLQDLRRPRSPQLIVMRAIGVEKCVNDFVARRIRSIAVTGRLRHGSPLSVDAALAGSGSQRHLPTTPGPGQASFCEHVFRYGYILRPHRGYLCALVAFLAQLR